MAYIRVEGSGNATPMSGTDLWVNPNPTANYSGGTVTLSEPIENFKYIRFDFTIESTLTLGGGKTGLYTPAQVKQNPWGDTGPQPCIYTLQTGSAPNKFRHMSIPSADASATNHSRIQFSNCLDANGGTHPNRLMPYKVIGYR